MRRETMAKLGLRSGWDTGVFLAYVAMLCAVVPFHEPWGDEALPWLIARFGVGKMLFHTLRYEGHPGVWYLLLWPAVHLHLPYAAINWISAAVAVAGIYVFLRLAPFPMYLRMVVPFSFFLAFQFAVVARSYVLYPLLGFLIAYVYRLEKRRPVTMAVLLGLLANLMFHGSLLAVGFAVVYAAKVWAELRRKQDAREWRQAKLGLGVFCAALLFLAACLWPVKDAMAPKTRSLWVYHYFALPADTPVDTAAAASDEVETMPVVAAPAATLPVRDAGSRLARIVRILTFSFAGSAVLALLYQLLFAGWLVRSGHGLMLLPIVLLFLFLEVVYAAEWHIGLLWVTFVVVLWMAWDTAIPERAMRLQNAVGVFLFLLCVLQLRWTYRADRWDIENSYAPAKGVAAELRLLPQGSRVAAFEEAGSVVPYFPAGKFFNLPPYDGWMRPHSDGMSFARVMRERPDAVVMKQDDPRVNVLVAEGYVLRKTVCGAVYFPNEETMPPLCLDVFVPQAR